MLLVASAANVRGARGLDSRSTLLGTALAPRAQCRQETRRAVFALMGARAQHRQRSMAAACDITGSYEKGQCISLAPASIHVAVRLGQQVRLAHAAPLVAHVLAAALPARCNHKRAQLGHDKTRQVRAPSYGSVQASVRLGDVLALTLGTSISSCTRSNIGRIAAYTRCNKL